MSISLIVAAGGRGIRFKNGIFPVKAGQSDRSRNKLCFSFLGQPLLAYTVARFQNIPEINETILAVPHSLRQEVKQWIRANRWKSVRVVLGGRTRAESVLNALKQVKSNSWVMVHDGARPLVPESAIKKLIAMRRLKNFQAGLLVKKVIPTIKQAAEDSRYVEKTLDRSFLYEAETPQLMKRKLLRDAYETQKNALKMSDEASLLESQGVKVRLCIHAGYNPKITHPEDIHVAEATAKGERNEMTKVGLGRDIHRLAAGRKMILGGYHIPCEKGPVGHSDGDVVLHAISDAVWGVLGLGDIGEHFSDLKKKFKNISSVKILQKALSDAKKRAWQISHVDMVITLEKPHLGKFKQRIKRKLAFLMDIKESQISVKAKTAESLGPEGQGLAVSCEAIVTMQKSES